MEKVRTLLKPPTLEITLLVSALLVAYGAIFISSIGAEPPPEGAMSAMMIGFVSMIFFLLSVGIAIISVISGIGGGVLFTPIMLAFTSVDSLIVRATGLIVAMFSGLIATGPFMRSGLANLKVSVLLAASFGFASLLGAVGAIYFANSLGQTGEGVIRFVLGLILAGLGIYFFFGGSKIEWPVAKKVDAFTKRLNLELPFYEKSLDKVVEYPMTRASWALLKIAVVGFIAGFFGVGGGWAIVPVQNLVMAVPIKVAAANSGVLSAIGGCIAVWPYLLTGAIIPLFVAPWLVGQVLGGMLGAKLLANVKAGYIRIILIGIMFFTSFSLVGRAMVLFGSINTVPMQLTGLMFLIAVAWVVQSVRKFRQIEALKERVAHKEV
jgi:uncharacterized membrane protein YfcA